MTANEKRMKARDKYRTILGRNKYSQAKRTYVNTKYKDGCYYSDCSSSVCWALREAGCPVTYGGSSLPSTVGIYLSKDVVEVPVKINSKGEITNPEILCITDLLLFAGTDTSRAYAGYVGHVEMVGEISGSKITIYGHGSGTPRKTEMQAYLRSRRSQSSPTKLGHRGLIKVVRRIADDGSAATDDSGSSTLGNRILKKGMSGADVRELQAALIQLGYSCGPDGADGDFGTNTVAAVKKFQQDKGLLVDGEAGPDTISVLRAAQKAANPATPATPTTPTTPAQPANGKRVVISGCTTCNIRTGPGTQYGSVGTAKSGDTFPALTIDGWVPILYFGNICWISPKYAKVEG